MMSMDLGAYRSLPIPQWLDVNCPKCAYPLRGLPEHRCPECGAEFNIDELVTDTTPLRPPEITARTRPVPQLGLECNGCGYPLRGLPGDQCPECGREFSLTDYIPPEPWGEVAVGASATETMLIFSHLRSLGIPCMITEARGTLGARGTDVFLGGVSKQLRVRRDYYLDALAAIAEATEKTGRPWTCPNCSEEVPGNFELCWKCQHGRGDEPVRN
ncbi:MAG TPA: hypothetical protein P5316_05955 [Phycisphaerae bacterium]|nr:hypothetical protein [Phycisphaerae bacterium]